MLTTQTLQKSLIMLFMVFILTPLAGHILSQPKTVSKLEKRSLASWKPYLESDDMSGFFHGVSEFVSDHFGFREQLIALKARFKLALNESPVDSVLMGRDDWFFLKTYDPLLMNQTDKAQILSAIETRASFVHQRYQALNRKNVHYLFFVAPNKMSIYPEHLPRLYSLMDHLASYREFSASLAQANRYYVDMVTILREAKETQGRNLYFKTDSHWSDLGASLAYQALVDEALKQHPELVIHPGDHAFVNRLLPDSDLIDLMGITAGSQTPTPSTTFPACARRTNIKAFLPNINVIRCGKNDTVAVLIGDSFMSKIYPYFAESVGALYIVNKGISDEKLFNLVDRVKADIVFEQTVQRDLAKPLTEQR
jgi:hypothetical protein